VESREAASIEAFKQAEGQHTQQLKDFYLVTRARRMTLTLEEREYPMLGGISICNYGEKSKRRLWTCPPRLPM